MGRVGRVILIAVVLFAVMLPGGAQAVVYNNAKVDKLIDDVAEGKYRPVYNSVSLVMTQATYIVGKRASVVLDNVGDYAFSAMVGAEFGTKTGNPHGAVIGAVGNVAVDAGKDAALLFFREYLKNPQAVARDIANQAMSDGLKAYKANVKMAKDLEFGDTLTDEQKRLFAKNHVMVQMLAPARDMYNAVRKDNDSPIADSEIANIFDKYKSLKEKNPVTSVILFIADVADALRDAELQLNQYEPLNDFYEKAAKFSRAAGIMSGDEAGTEVPEDESEGMDNEPGDDPMVDYDGNGIAPITTPIDVVYKPSKGRVSLSSYSLNPQSGREIRVEIKGEQVVARSHGGLSVDLKISEMSQLPAGVASIHLMGEMTDKGKILSVNTDYLDSRGNPVDSADVRAAKGQVRKAALTNRNMELAEAPVASGDVLASIHIDDAMQGEMAFNFQGAEQIDYVVRGLKRHEGADVILAEIPLGTAVTGTAHVGGSTASIGMEFSGHIMMDHRRGVILQSVLELKATVSEATTGESGSFSVRVVTDFEETEPMVADATREPEEDIGGNVTVQGLRYVKTDAGWAVSGKLVDDWERPAVRRKVSLEARTTGEQVASKTDGRGRFSILVTDAFTFLQGIQEMTLTVDDLPLSRLLAGASQGDPERVQAEIDCRSFIQEMTQVMGGLQKGPDGKGLLHGMTVGGGFLEVRYPLSIEEYENALGVDGDAFMESLRRRVISLLAYYIETPGVFAGFTSTGDELCVCIQIPLSYFLPETIPGS